MSIKSLHNNFILYSLLSIIIAIYAPPYYSNVYNYIVFGIYIIQLCIFFKLKEKTSYWDFDILFLLVFSLAAFAYPLFIYIENDPFLPFFQLEFNVSNISKAVGLSSIAATSYMIGSLCKKKISLKKESKVEINTNFLIFLVLLFSFIFIASGGISYYQSMYDKRIEVTLSGITLQAQALLQATAIAAIGIEFYNIRINKRKANKLLFAILILVALMMLYAGNRTLAMQLMLPISFFIAYHYIKITKTRLCILLIIGGISMWLVGRLRGGREITEETIQLANLIKDIVLPARNNYLVFEVVEKTGYTWGYTMSGGIIGTIPSLERILNIFGLDSRKIGSATFFTDYTYPGGDAPFGLGTMLQADAYLSFGIVGVFIVFGGIGYIVSHIHNSLKKDNFYSYIIYSALMAHAIFWIRAEAFYPLKIIIWSLIIAYLSRHVVIKWKEK